MRQSREINKVAAWLAGYDVFISYRHADALPYAKALEAVLESKGLMVFRDETDEDSGVALDIFIKRACSAQTFVLLVTPTVFASSNVLAELSSYLTQRIDTWYKRPFSRIISINVDQTLSKVPPEPAEWKRLSNFVYEPETLEAITKGVPSQAVVERLCRANSFMHAWRSFILIIGTIITGILLAIIIASLYLYSVLQKLSYTNNDLRTAQQESATLASSNQNLNTKNDELQKQANELSGQSKMLLNRIEAQNQLSVDPLLAYRLAVEAYKLKPDPTNRKLILASLSKIDLFYHYQKRGYSIEDFKEPFILLGGTAKAGQEKNFLVLNMNTLETQPIPTKADYVWIIPTATTWRLLTQTFSGSDFDSTSVYQLWNQDGKGLVDTAPGGSLSDIKFLNNGKVRIPLSEEHKVLVWDLVNNRKEFMNQGNNKDFDPIRALDTRSDGVSAASNGINRLVLLDKDEKIIPESSTEADFDPLFSAAKWSPDGQYLALYDSEFKRLGIWNPMMKSLVWLNPNKWMAERYAWSLTGHLLAFSGRTENEVDVTVKLVDANLPEQTPSVIYRGGVPINSMVFSQGDKQLVISDREGNISILEIATGEVVAKGYHKGVSQLFSSQNTLYSSSPDDFRVWNLAPAAHWVFQSTGKRIYGARGAADPAWQWLAVPFIENETRGIELRKIQSDERRTLSTPPSESIKLEFSEDGQWLVLETFDILRIYDTDSWDYHDFALQQNDSQFISLRMVAGTVYAHALGKDWMNNTSDEYDYTITLNQDQPAFTSRVYADDQEKDQTDQTLVWKDIEGWGSGNIYNYRSAGILSSPKSGWAYYVKCRDQALAARDCDVQFIPRDLEKLMNLYNAFLWKLTDEELKAWLPS